MASQSSLIGLLRVLLSANVAEYERDMKKSVDVTKGVTSELKKTAAETSTLGSKLATALNIPPSVTSGIASVAGSLKLLGIAGAALKVADWTSDFVAFAGQISDLAERTDIPIRQLQRLQYAGDLVGVSVEQITAAVSQMQNRLAGGDDSAVAALNKLGLSWERLQALDPGAQFEAIATEIAKIPDPAQRTAVAMDLFGRSGATLLPLLKQNLKEVGDEGERVGAVIGDDLIKAGDQLGDSWTKLKAIFKGAFAESLRPMLEFLGRFPKEVENAKASLNALGLDTKKASEDIKDLGRWFSVLRGEMEKLPEIKPSQSVDRLFGGTDPDKLRADMLKNMRLTADERKAIEADLTQTVKDQIKATDQWTEAVKRLRDQLSGAKLQEEVRMLEAATRGLTDEQMKQPRTMDAVAAAIKKLRDDGARLTPELEKLRETTRRFVTELPVLTREGGFQGFFSGAGFAIRTEVELPLNDATAAAKGFFDLVEARNDEFGDFVTNLQSLANLPAFQPGQFEGFFSDSFLKARNDDLRTTREQIDNVVDALRTLGQVGPESIRDIVFAIDDMISGWQFATDAIAAFGKSGTSILDKLASGLNLISGLLSIGQGLFALGERLFGDRGRDLVEDFAAEHGGFDRLHEKLLELGADGERLWIKLTQGVGRNNPQEAIAAIRLVEEALAKGADAARDAANEHEDATARASEAHRKMVDSIQQEYDRLTSEIDRLTQSIADEAPEEVMGVVEQQTRDRIALIEEERRKVGEELEAATQAIQEDAQAVGQTVDEHIGGALEGIGSDLDRNAGEWEEWSRLVGASVRGLAIGVELPEPPDGGMPGFASGTPGLDFSDFHDRTQVMLHSREAVVPESRVGEFAGQVATALGDGGGSYGPMRSTTILEVDKRALGRVVADVLPNELRRLGIRVRASGP